jgi:hypothetical protein
VKEYRLWILRFPDFLCSLVAPARFLRLSLTKAAYAVAFSAAYRKSGFSAGNAKASLVGRFFIRGYSVYDKSARKYLIQIRSSEDR